MDSNHRRYKPADLQSAPFGHSGIRPIANAKLTINFESAKYFNDYPQNSPNYYMDNIVAKYKHRGTEAQSMDNNVLIIKDMARRNCLQF